jgi:hypothetical protein
MVMTIARNCLFALLACGLLAWAGHAAMAQVVPGASQRDCQTIRTCNFTRGGVYRGCLSSYSCRVCRFIRSSCTIDGTRKTCQAMKCNWG